MNKSLNLFTSYTSLFHPLGILSNSDGEGKRVNITSKLFGNVMQRLCVPDFGLNNTEHQVNTETICQERHFYFGIVSLVLIYTPSVNILSSIYGPCIAGLLSSMWGFILLVSGSFLWISANIFQLRILAAFFGVLGIYLIIVGNIQEGKGRSANDKRILLRKEGDVLLKAFAFPILLIFSPVILLLLRFMLAIKPYSEFIQYQTKNLVLIFKGQTKLCLRLYIMLVLAWPNTWVKWASLISLIVSNPFPISKMYAELKFETWESWDPENGLKIRKGRHYYPIFATNLLSRALAVSVIMVYYKHQALIPMGYLLLDFVENNKILQPASTRKLKSIVGSLTL